MVRAVIRACDGDPGRKRADNGKWSECNPGLRKKGMKRVNKKACRQPDSGIERSLFNHTRSEGVVSCFGSFGQNRSCLLQASVAGPLVGWPANLKPPQVCVLFQAARA
jgi:hypothetical protein